MFSLNTRFNNTIRSWRRLAAASRSSKNIKLILVVALIVFLCRNNTAVLLDDAIQFSNSNVATLTPLVKGIKRS